MKKFSLLNTVAALAIGFGVLVGAAPAFAEEPAAPSAEEVASALDVVKAELAKQGLTIETATSAQLAKVVQKLGGLPAVVAAVLTNAPAAKSADAVQAIVTAAVQVNESAAVAIAQAAVNAAPEQAANIKEAVSTAAPAAAEQVAAVTPTSSDSSTKTDTASQDDSSTEEDSSQETKSTSKPGDSASQTAQEGNSQPVTETPSSLR
ncbi:MAG: hypothetical protein ACOYK8_02360 [Alphaproteobacteria bacterium]